MLETRSCIDRRMLWSPGVFFRRVRLSSSGSTASSGFATCGGAPDIRPLGMPPVSDGRPCWAGCHCTGTCGVTGGVWLIGYPSLAGDAARKGPGFAVLKAAVAAAVAAAAEAAAAAVAALVQHVLVPAPPGHLEPPVEGEEEVGLQD